MRLRLGPGPVFVYEWLTATRRWQLYALRAAFVGMILIGMILVWTSLYRSNPSAQTVSIQEMARYGEAFYTTVVAVELTLVLLAAPAATAGAVCLDKARGTLDHILATDLSNAEIVLGKLGVRLTPVLGLVACVLPITALSGLLGGIDPDALFGSFLVAIGCAALGCSLAMTLSVWGRKTHEVLMMTYLILILWLSFPLLVILVVFAFRTSAPPWVAAPLLWDCVALSNPYYLAFAPYSDPG
jgi:ABC-type transport system involved in multi-copper enzyme maturation permease subunit